MASVMGFELTKEQHAEIIEAAMVQIREKAIANATNMLSSTITNAITEVLYKEVQELVKAEVVPAVKASLETQREALIAGCIAASEDMAKLLQEAMVKRLTDRLAQTYSANEVFKGLFGGPGF